MSGQTIDSGALLDENQRLRSALQLIAGCWCARVESPTGRPPQDADAVLEKVIEIAEKALSSNTEAETSERSE